MKAWLLREVSSSAKPGYKVVNRKGFKSNYLIDYDEGDELLGCSHLFFFFFFCFCSVQL